jgi:DNA polymerase-3 subunit delta'
VSLPEPRANPEFFGHEAAAAALVEAALSGRLHHAWLIAGPAGIGKETLA